MAQLVTEAADGRLVARTFIVHRHVHRHVYRHARPGALPLFFFFFFIVLNGTELAHGTALSSRS
eukprot:13957647-Heterocapsa_arctica.AAC.1